MSDDVRGGWLLHLVCTVCGAEEVYRGFVQTQAADAAKAAGWLVDTDALHVTAYDRYALCPTHHSEER